MNRHKNARLTARGREEMLRRLETKSAAAVAAGYGLSVRTVRKWKHCYAMGGFEALADASSRPKRCRCSLTKAEMAQIHELGAQGGGRDCASSRPVPQYGVSRVTQIGSFPAALPGA